MISKIKKHVTENRLATLTLVLALAFTFYGLPSQIYQIWLKHSVREVSAPTFALLGLQSFVWVVYGYREKGKDIAIMVPNAFVFLFAVIILIECFIFR